jgi:hypothetical protein
MKMPGERGPLGPLVRFEEFDRALRKGGSSRAIAMACIYAGWPVLLAGAWILGPFTPADHWYPWAFMSVLLAFVPLTMLTGRANAVLASPAGAGSEDQRKLALLQEVRVAKPPVDVCTECLEMFGTEHDGICPTCRQKFTVMRVLGEREVRRLDVLLGSPQ